MKRLSFIVLFLICTLCIASCNNTSFEETTDAFAETTEARILESANLIGWGESITVTKDELIKLQNILSKTEYIPSDTEYTAPLPGAVSLQITLTYTDSSTEILTFPMCVKDDVTYITIDDSVKNEIYHTYFEALITSDSLTITE